MDLAVQPANQALVDHRDQVDQQVLPDLVVQVDLLAHRAQVDHLEIPVQVVQVDLVVPVDLPELQDLLATLAQVGQVDQPA